MEKPDSKLANPLEQVHGQVALWFTRPCGHHERTRDALQKPCETCADYAEAHALEKLAAAIDEASARA